MLVILGAMQEEIDQIVATASIDSTNHWGPFQIHLGNIEGKKACIVKCGVGKVLSSMLTQYLITTYQPSAILFAGLAGALNPKFQIGDVIIGADCIQHDLETSVLGFVRGQIPYTDIRIINADPQLVAIAQAYQPQDYSVYVGRILTGDQFISHADKASHQYLVSELDGDAVDMEGASVGTVAMLNRVPFLIIRTISDRADGSSPENFQAFLPEAAKHATDFIRSIVKRIPA